MATRSFENTIIKREVSIAIERLLIAPSTVTWTPTAVNLDPSSGAFPAGFKDLGAVVEDNVTLTISRNLFQLETGLPKVLQYSAVLGVSGVLEVQLHSLSPRKKAYALGNVNPVNVVGTVFGTSPMTLAPTMLKLEVDSVSPGWVVGDVIMTDPTTAGLTSSDNEAEIGTIIMDAGGTVWAVYFVAPGFPTTPGAVATPWRAAKLNAVRQPYGTSKIKEYHIIGVADCIDGFQIVHDMQKARVAPGDMQEAFKPTENFRTMARWALFGYATTIYPTDSELIVAERFWFPKGNS